MHACNLNEGDYAARADGKGGAIRGGVMACVRVRLHRIPKTDGTKLYSVLCCLCQSVEGLVLIVIIHFSGGVGNPCIPGDEWNVRGNCPITYTWRARVGKSVLSSARVVAPSKSRFLAYFFLLVVLPKCMERGPRFHTHAGNE